VKTAILLLALAWPARAQKTDHETLEVLGWDKACGVAIAHYGYPKLGEAIQDLPSYANIGVASIAPGSQAQAVRWLYTAENQGEWSEKEADRAKERLAKLGYAQPGYVETIRPDGVVDKRDLPRLIYSTETFRIDSPGPWPDGSWRLSKIYYNPLGSCGLLTYTKGGAKDLFALLLARFGNPGARDDRALSHVTNGLLLLEDGDEDGALAETGIAATMDPTSGPALYHHAALLKLTGHMQEAVAELKAAIALDSSYAQKWKDDPDFGPMRGFPDFARLMTAGFGRGASPDR
jgi:tetratricopeptide (TPR) repeat protein